MTGLELIFEISEEVQMPCEAITWFNERQLDSLREFVEIAEEKNE